MKNGLNECKRQVKYMFEIGDKVYCKSMKQNLVVGCKEGNYTYICIDILYGNLETKRFGTFVLSEHDLVSGWKSKEELIELRQGDF